jgi:hypothetical protein
VAVVVVSDVTATRKFPAPGDEERPISALVAALVPSPSSLFDVRPIGIDPSFERGERFVEGLAEFGELVEGGSVDSAGVEVTHDKAVAFGSSEGVGEYFVRDTVQGLIEFLVAATALH